MVFTKLKWSLPGTCKNTNECCDSDATCNAKGVCAQSCSKYPGDCK